MNSFTITVEYLTGYAVATDPWNREEAEWPPHPARFFMALTAAHFETEGDQAERLALQWLEQLDQPALFVPEASWRQTVTVYVPVNDATGLGALPTKRSRQPRMFPRVYVDDQTLKFIWQNASDADVHLDALARLCGKVTRIGHSSSIVWVRLNRTSEETVATHVPNEATFDHRLRTVSDGTVDRLESSFNQANVIEYADLDRRAQLLKGKEKAEFKSSIAKRFPHGIPVSRRPAITTTTGYARKATQAERTDRQSCFDSDMIVLRQHEDDVQRFGLESTGLLASVLRDTIMKRSGTQPVPDWVSGHDGPDGLKLARGSHIAVIPLPFVAHKHADGHILGAAIVCPREVSIKERAKVLSKLLYNENGAPSRIVLKLGRAGICTLERETRLYPPLALQPLTWVNSSKEWASVTPIVLDRFPKSDRINNRAAWNEEVAEIIAQACINIGLPSPIEVRIEKTPFFRGSLRAMPGQGGFPLLPNKQSAPRFQVHARIEFDEWVRGPVLLGTGRYRGYGLCRPITSGGMS